MYFCSLKRDVPVAQLVEQLTLNQWVQGSNPCGDTEKTDLESVFFYLLYYKIQGSGPEMLPEGAIFSKPTCNVGGSWAYRQWRARGTRSQKSSVFEIFSLFHNNGVEFVPMFCIGIFFR